MKIKGYTLIEILVVLVIIATLAALAWPKYKGIQEKALNQEAKASLALIRAAEKIYRLEEGFYFPYSSSVPVSEDTVADINSYLKISLPESATASWSITLSNTPANLGSGTAYRKPAVNAGDARVWSVDFPPDPVLGDKDPTCVEGTGHNCP